VGAHVREAGSAAKASVAATITTADTASAPAGDQTAASPSVKGGPATQVT